MNHRIGPGICRVAVLAGLLCAVAPIAVLAQEEAAPPTAEPTADTRAEPAAAEGSAEPTAAESEAEPAAAKPPAEPTAEPAADPAATDAPPASIPVSAIREEPADLPPPPKEGAQTIDEITVTAQKVEQSAKDVPISISVVNDKFIAEKGITDVREAMLFVPNVKVESAGFFAAPRARGFSFNNNNKAIEPPLGIAIDGFPYTTPTYFNSAVFDISRIEVLRGPQGTTFGKNTTAGLIHMITNDPTAEWTGRLDLQGGELGRRRIELAGGGPLIEDFVDFRIALLSNERDGFIENTTHRINPDVPEFYRGQRHEGGRAKLAFPDLLGSSFKLTYEYVELEQIGAGEEIARSTPTFQDAILNYDPNADFIEGNYIASIDGADGREATVETMNLEWKSFFGDWGLTGLAGRSVLDTTLAVDADFTPVPALHGFGGDINPTTTFELRGEMGGLEGLLGLGGSGTSDLLLGVFYQKREILDSTFTFTFFDGPFLELTAAAAGTPPPPTASPPEAAIDEVTQFFEQTGDVKAVFGQVQWRFREQWALQTGARFSKERKDGLWNQFFTTPPPNAVVQAAGLREFEATRRISETHVQPKISLQYDPIEEVSLFVHWARAFKGGGFNAFAFADEDSDEIPEPAENLPVTCVGAPVNNCTQLSIANQLQFKPETVEEWGIDLKTSPLFGGSLRLNLSLFRMDATDFQVLGRVRRPNSIGIGITKVENAPKARAQGVEGDIMWLPFNGMTMIATLGYNDTEYLDFKTNECPADRTNEDGDNIDRCDATGKAFPFAPKWDSTLTASYVSAPLFWGINFNLGATVEYQSSQLLDLDLDERKRQDGFARYKANIGFGSLEQGWSFQVLGNNLSNQVTSVRKGDVFGGQFISVQESPREIFGQFRYSF